MKQLTTTVNPGPMGWEWAVLIDGKQWAAGGEPSEAEAIKVAEIAAKIAISRGETK